MCVDVYKTNRLSPPLGIGIGAENWRKYFVWKTTFIYRIKIYKNCFVSILKES